MIRAGGRGRSVLPSTHRGFSALGGNGSGARRETFTE